MRGLDVAFFTELLSMNLDHAGEVKTAAVDEFLVDAAELDVT